LSANVPLLNRANTFSAQNVFSNSVGAAALMVHGSTPLINFYDIGMPVDRRIVALISSNQGLVINIINDAYTVASTLLSITPGGLVVGSGNSPIYADGSPITNINAANLSHGIVAAGRLGTNAATAGYFLRSDNSWQPVTTATVDPVPSGLIGMFMAGCPAGWTRVAAFDNRFPLGSPSPGIAGGNVTHLHRVFGSVAAGGTHRHHASLGGSANGTVSGRTADENNATPVAVNRSGPDLMLFLPHSHAVNIGATFSANVSGDTDDNGNHAHTFTVDSDQGGDYPPYMSVVFCQKN